MVKYWKFFPQYLELSQGYSLSPFLFSIILEVLANIITPDREINKTKKRCTSVMLSRSCVCTKLLGIYTQKTPLGVNEFYKAIVYKAII